MTQTVIGAFHSTIIGMSALGQQRPLKYEQILACERLLSGHTGHWPLAPKFGFVEWRVSALLQYQPLGWYYLVLNVWLLLTQSSR